MTNEQIDAVARRALELICEHLERRAAERGAAVRGLTVALDAAGAYIEIARDHAAALPPEAP